MIISLAVERFWRQFLATLPSDSPIRDACYAAESFGGTPELAESIGRLVLEGKKTATCSALWAWTAEGMDLPIAGQYTIVLGGDERPLCLIETTEVTVRSFVEVDAEFAAAEGEGDRSLAHWRREHWKFFTNSLGEIGRAPTEEMPLVCERFRIVYP